MRIVPILVATPRFAAIVKEAVPVPVPVDIEDSHGSLPIAVHEHVGVVVTFTIPPVASGPTLTDGADSAYVQEFTSIDAVAAFPLPPFEDVIASVVFCFVPVDVADTRTLIVHVSPGASVAPRSDTDVAPAAAVNAPEEHCFSTPAGRSTTTPLGKLSTNATSFKGTATFSFDNVKVSVAEPPTGIVAALKAFAM